MATTQDPFVGRVIDNRYEIQQRVGEGGMGVVYKARQLSIDRIIAMKMLNAQMQGDQQWVQRFYNEAKACSRLQHPNTIRMFDFGQTQEGRLFMTMEFLDGESLRDVINRGQMPASRVIKILIQCCASLAEAHSIGIVHRDIKPDNIFLLNMAGSPDFVKVLDFSVAKLAEGDRMKTQAGVVFGTPQYMSPEQSRGIPLDARSDLYALGIVAYEMLVGNVPFNDDNNPMAIIMMHRDAPVPPMPASIPYPAQMVVRRALEKDPARRYQSAGEMMQHCQQVFSELNGGGMSIGGGGVPKTMIASPAMNPAMQQQPQAQPQPQAAPMGSQPGYQQASAAQKTIVAGMAPQIVGGQLVPQQMAQPQPMAQQQPAGSAAKTMIAQPSPFAGQPPQQAMAQQQPAGSAAKTMIAQPSPFAGQQPMGQPHMSQPMGQPHMSQPMGQPGFGGPPQQQPGGPAKTMMLQPSEGVVSVAAQQRVSTGPMAAQRPPADEGATSLFWAVSLIVGVAVGVVAYLIVLQV